jgi:hypothetical protein
MNKAKLNKFAYILLRERLTFGDMEAILNEVESPDEPDMVPAVAGYIEEIVSRITTSGLKCAENMCNTEFEDVRMVRNTVVLGSAGINQRLEFVEVPMCADCRRRNPEAVLL